LLSLFFGLSIIIMMIVIELMKRNIVIPVNKMSFATMKIAGETMRATFAFEMGNVNLTRIRDAVEKVKELDIKSNDEIGQLYEYFCDMTRDTYNFIHQVHEQNDRIQRMQEVIIMEFAEMVEARDKSTGDHIKKTAEYVEAIAKELQKEGKFKGVLNDAYVHKLKQAAPLHDIGKIAVSDLILNKPGKLTDDEFAIMKTHSTISGQMVMILLEGMEEEHLVETAYHVARYHHERWDGKGYPEGLVGEMIPLEARIMAVADVYDALVSKRVYKEPMSYEKAAQIMQEGMGTQFDPNMHLVFLSCRSRLEHYYSLVQ
jgi:HD-GYP domain-containing protein (c-di-GMP phosphodiesterase class II)